MSRRNRSKRIQLGTHCLICGVSDARMVRDHDHTTNKVRGTLCEDCNGRLGVYELNKKRTVKRGKASFRAWIETYKEQIEAHLKRDTGEFYYRPKSLRGEHVRFKKPKKDKAPNSFKALCDGILAGELYANHT